MQVLPVILSLYSVLIPTKTWFAPKQPLMVQIKGAGTDVSLVLTDFVGSAIEPKGSTDIAGDRSIDLRTLYPQIDTPGTHVLWAVPKKSLLPDFVGTPIVIEVRQDRRPDAPTDAMVIKIEPLLYATIDTNHGPMTAVFYYDSAPHTVANFLALAGGGFYDGLEFFRVQPDICIQTGDPRNDGTGGPGYRIENEFNDHQHLEGVLSMSRQIDPIETQGVLPRNEFANSAGSQFFICLKYDKTKEFDRRFTAFGKITEGFKVAQAIGNVKLADPKTGKPEKPQVIQSIKIQPVTTQNNPYADLMNMKRQTPTTLPVLP
jgi:cyclophilin family peptidyl-prolyl cis-trans isomerase